MVTWNVSTVPGPETYYLFDYWNIITKEKKNPCFTIFTNIAPLLHRIRVVTYKTYGL